MHSFLHKLFVLFKMEWTVMLNYRGEAIIWMVGAFIQPLVSLSVWLSIREEQQYSDFSVQDYVLYFTGILLVERLTRSWDVWEVDSQIREGTFSAMLLRPLHPVYWSIAQNLTYKCFFAIIMIPSWFILSIFLPSLRLPTSFVMILGAVLAIILSSTIRLLIGYEFGLLAFWTHRAVAIYMLYEGIHLFLAGRIAPLSMFPEWLVVITKILPFYAMVGFPVELLTGQSAFQLKEIWIGFASQFIWIIILYIIFRWQWKQGLKKYGAVGG